MKRTDPVGFFDSGLGGISVLQKTRRLLPDEYYIYYGDSSHAPYGVKTPQQVQALAEQAVQHLLAQGVKAIVIACNTATSAAADILRQQHPEIPIIGTEPALKPAVERHSGGRIAVMATAMTLQEQKFQALWEHYHRQARIIPVPCSGLMEFVERGELEGERLEQFLRQCLTPCGEEPVDAVVLGCTHYPFLTPVIRKLVPGAEIFDGADGVARQLRRKLAEQDLLKTDGKAGEVIFQNSLRDSQILERCSRLLAYCPERG